MNLGELVESYLQWKQVCSASEHTVRAYRNDLRRLRQLLGDDLPVEDFDIFALQRFHVELQNSPLAITSIRRALACTSGLVKWAWNEGIYKVNFAAALRKPRLPVTLPKEVPSVEQMKAMLDGGCPTSWPERDRVALELLYCDLRASELVALDLRDRVASDELIAKGKGRKERKIPLTEASQAAIAAYLPSRRRVLQMRGVETDALLINLKTGTRLTTRSVGRIVKAIAQAKGLSKTISPHRLRAAYATHMLENGAPLSPVSQLLGHARLATTMCYSGGVSWKRMREAYDRTFKR